MAEKRSMNKPTPAMPGGTPVETGRTPAGDERRSGYESNGDSPKQIERDIRRTRSEMSETIDDITLRLDPDYIKEQAKDALRSTAKNAGTTMINTIKDNPLPALIASMSIGWLMVRSGDSRRDGDDRRRFEDEYYWRFGRYPETPDASHDVRRRARTYPGPGVAAGHYEQGTEDDNDDSLKDRAGDAADKVREQTNDWVDRTSDATGDLMDRTAQYGRQAGGWMERKMDENPIAVGVVAMAAGSLVGLSVPETRKEDEWMGARSDRMKRSAREGAVDRIDEAGEAAKKQVERAAGRESTGNGTAEHSEQDSAGREDGSGSSGQTSSGQTQSGHTSSGFTRPGASNH